MLKLEILNKFFKINMTTKVGFEISKISQL